jgi:hypothetical protein
MKTSLTSIYRAATTVMAVTADLLWQVSPRRFRMASTSEELLDLFEEKYAMQDELLPVTSSNHEGKAPEKSASLAASVDLAPKGDKLKAPFARRFYMGRKGHRLFVLSDLHSQRVISPSATRLSSCRA